MKIGHFRKKLLEFVYGQFSLVEGSIIAILNNFAVYHVENCTFIMFVIPGDMISFAWIYVFDEMRSTFFATHCLALSPLFDSGNSFDTRYLSAPAHSCHYFIFSTIKSN